MHHPTFLDANGRMPSPILVCQRNFACWLVAVCVATVCVVGTAFAASAHANESPKAEPNETFSLADDFSLNKNDAGSVWSYGLYDPARTPSSLAMLAVSKRTANELWGSDFDSPPRMWSDAAGYWGIGRNDSGRELVSTRNGTKWSPGEILLHPKGGESPAGLAICWTAPRDLLIEARYSFGTVANGSNGIGYRLVKRSRDIDAEVVGLGNVGQRVTHHLRSLAVAKGDQLQFLLDTSGDAAGDIVQAEIAIKSQPEPAMPSISVQPLGGTITEGTRFSFSAAADGAESIQWRKNGVAIAGATSPTFRIDAAKNRDEGEYTVVVDTVVSPAASLRVAAASVRPERFASPTPRQVFASTLAEQQAQLETNELMLRFAASRKKLAADRFRPAYHFVSPESQLNDPNGLCFWQGRWHLFYQGYPPDEFPDAKDIAQRRQHWGHAVSDDLVRWRDLPYAIYPGVERMCFSGGTVAEADQVVAFYPGIHAGQMVAVSKDPLLLNWDKLGGGPVHGSPAGDSCIWKEGDTYYGLVSADLLVSSQNLTDWKVHGPFVEANPFPLGDAAACPGFVPIGDKHLLVSFSHTTGGQYLLGDYDAQRHRYRPYAQGRFNHGLVSPGGVHAPCAAMDGKGNVVNILNINDGKFSPDWDQILSLAQRLSLGKDSQLRLAPVDAITTLRGAHQHVGETKLPANREIVLEKIKGNTLELELEIDPREARWVQLNVLRSADAEEQTSITFYNFDRPLSIWYHTPGTICLDGSRSSELGDVWLRPPEKTTFERGGETLKLRVFVDRNVVEVFVGEKRYLAMRVYPGRDDSVGVSLRAQGQDAVLKRLDAWEMNSIWP
ncbi:MAG: GH32 C-terminal domain-containing protein [Pirellulales bacterium]